MGHGEAPTSRRTPVKPFASVPLFDGRNHALDPDPLRTYSKGKGGMDGSASLSPAGLAIIFDFFLMVPEYSAAAAPAGLDRLAILILRLRPVHDLAASMLMLLFELILEPEILLLLLLLRFAFVGVLEPGRPNVGDDTSRGGLRLKGSYSA